VEPTVYNQQVTFKPEIQGIFIKDLESGYIRLQNYLFAFD
jgi:hypothetical protein